MEWRLFNFAAALALGLAGCQPESPEGIPHATVNDWLPMRIGEVAIQVQVAITSEEQQKGLMYRESLQADHGMLFPYRQARQMSFWMANTSLPLDIGFFDGDGVLLEIRRMYPFDTNRTVANSSQAQYALEMNSGWFHEQKLLPGARMDMGMLADALRARGQNPAAYGIRD